MYETRFTVFIDILGFGSLVDSSTNDPSITESIYKALNSLSSDAIQEQLYGQINEDLVPPDKIQEVRATVAQFNSVLSTKHPVSVSYFSDSLVLSALSDDVIASQAILERIAKLSVQLWQEHSLVIRGGITIGELFHKNNGPPIWSCDESSLLFRV